MAMCGGRERSPCPRPHPQTFPILVRPKSSSWGEFLSLPRSPLSPR
ncbi:uncharacterized protein G2W53_000743 [Senna tora]|uniref:Uncharacterized protein n=1 Tax=Senna tora TaxID=362788 RepID=A0A834XIG0_9FABA|nr:uncharacterized protein G2W53_000743 [Senna tora]